MNKKTGKVFWSFKKWLALFVSVLVVSSGISYIVTAEGYLGGWTKCGVALYRPSTGMWYFDENLDGHTDARLGPWGWIGDVPISGDFNSSTGDLILDDIGFFRPSNRKWYYNYLGTIPFAHTAEMEGPWGAAGDIPIVGDFDVDGNNDDVAVFRPASRIWYFDYNHNTTTNEIMDQPWGLPGDRPLAGDFDCDSRINDIAVFRPSTHMWYYDYDHNGTTDATRGPWGYAEDLPVAGDFDADGFWDDIAIFRPSNQMWYFDYDHNGTTDKRMGPWGAREDIPIAVHTIFPY